MKLNYDKPSDVLYISKGLPRPALTEQDDNGLLLRRDMVSNEPVGVTIISFSSWLNDLNALVFIVGNFLGIPYKKVFNSIQTYDWKANG